MAHLKQGERAGSIAFATVGRPQYGFDIFSLPFPHKLFKIEVTSGSLERAVHEFNTEQTQSASSGLHAHSESDRELKHTDGQSVNFTGHFVPGWVGRRWLKHAAGRMARTKNAPPAEARISSAASAIEHMRLGEGSEDRALGLIFVSERGGSPSIYASLVDIPGHDKRFADSNEGEKTEGATSAHASKQGGTGRSCTSGLGARQIDKVSRDDVSGDVSGDVSDGVSGDVSGGDVSADGRVVALTDGFWMEDRPGVTPDGERLVFSSTREDSGKAHLSWSAVYHMDRATGTVHRLTPKGSADFSPAVSPDGKLVAAATQPDVGTLHVSEPYTFDIVVFDLEDGASRRHVARNGGWPAFTPDSKAVYFHRKCEDGWWSIFKAELPPVCTDATSPPQRDVSEVRVTPRGMHAVTPAVHPSGKWLAVATRRKGSQHRQIELLNLVTGAFTPLTEPVTPEAHHYSPFFSPNGTRVGYHRSRGVGSRPEAGGGNGDGASSPKEAEGWVLVRRAEAQPGAGVNGGFGGCPVHQSPADESVHTESFKKASPPSESPPVNESRQKGKSEQGTRSARAKEREASFTVPNVEFVQSPDETVSLLRVEGAFLAFSHDGSKLAMVHNMGGEDGEIVVVNPDGSGRRTVVHAPAFGLSWGEGEIFYSEGPIFASERTEVRIVKVRVRGQRSGSQSARADVSADVGGADVTVLTSPGTGNNAFPAASPDGARVVFRSSRSGHKNLYIMSSVDGDRGGLFRLTEGPWDDTMPNWSPSGEWIAFSSDRANPGQGGFDIYVVRPNGTGLRKLVDAGGGRANHPAFSPDSTRVTFAGDFAWVSAEPVAYPRQFQPYGEVYVVHIDDSNLRRMTHNAYEDGTVAWGRRYVAREAVSEEGIALIGQMTDSIRM